MSDTLMSPVEAFLQHSRELLELAESGQWEALESGLARRDAELSGLTDERFLARVAETGQEQAFRDAITDIQRLNDRIVALAEHHKADISASLKESRKADEGIRAYRDKF